VDPVIGALEVSYAVFAIPALYENAIVNAEYSVYNVISNLRFRPHPFSGVMSIEV
jgi:hypothetical protein